MLSSNPFGPRMQPCWIALKTWKTELTEPTFASWICLKEVKMVMTLLILSQSSWKKSWGTTNSPKLYCAHCTAGPKPIAGRRPRPFILCFHQYWEKDTVLRWSRQHEVKYKGTTLRIYPDLSTTLANKSSAFNSVKRVLYQRGLFFKEKATFLRHQKRAKHSRITMQCKHLPIANCDWRRMTVIHILWQPCTLGSGIVCCR